MDLHIFFFVMLALPSLMAEQMDWGDNPNMVEEANYIEGRENVKIMVVIEGEDIELECHVLSTSYPVSEISWKINGKEEKTNEQPIISTAYGEVFIQSHLQMSNISRDRDGSSVSCNYAKGQYGGSVRAVLAVFKMQFCQAGGGNVRVVAKEAGRDRPGETFVEDRIKDKIRNITGEHKVMLENGEYSVTVPYNSLIGNNKLVELHPQLIMDGVDRIGPCDGLTIITTTTTKTLEVNTTEKDMEKENTKQNNDFKQIETRNKYFNMRNNSNNSNNSIAVLVKETDKLKDANFKWPDFAILTGLLLIIIILADYEDEDASKTKIRQL
eukprot:GFUD01036152.1.p1 GENE.GFUD01036152.1~~GFUD01036152.1.p1  ORF type:complete len:326 (-),score=86.75 GFUD01036152.1:715-1692(-)